MSFIDAADAAYPPNYSTLPKNVSVFLGYVGAPYCTPHIWSVREAQIAKEAVGDWWPIWTVHYSPVNADYGTWCAQGMVAKLAEGYPVTHDTPVFLDVEQITINHSGRSNSRACVEAWISGMARAGYNKAYAYCTDKVGGQWLPHWTNVRPTSLPTDLVGWQYRNAGAYDLSVFDAKIAPEVKPVLKPKHDPSDPGPGKPIPTPVPHPPVVRRYTVQRGDTLSSIAKRFGFDSWRDLYKLNRRVIGSNPDLIHPGMVLDVSHSRHYTVKQGDTLSSIAKEFGVSSWREIFQMNRSTIGDNPDLIHPGMVLTIP